MRRKRQQVVGLSVVLCMLFTMSVIGVATAQPTADIVPSTQDVSPGESFDVSIFMDTDGHKWVSGRVEHLTFDGTVVETTAGDVVPGDLLVTPSVATKQVNNTAGTVRFDAGDIDWASQTSPGNYMTVTFTVKATAAPGTYPIAITWMRFMDETATVWVTPDIVVTNGTVTVTDGTPPTYSNIVVSPVSPTTYVSGQNYTFNITVQDNVAIDTVLFEFDGVNYTDYAHVNSVFSYQLTGLAGGTHTYRWYMNDTSNNWNSTPSQNYVINKAATTVNLLLNGTDGNVTIDYGEPVNLSATLSIADTVTLYVAGLDAGSGIGYVENVTTLGVGVHNITASYPGNENYTGSSETHWLTVLSPYPRWDINEDGVVDDVDLGLLLLHYGETTVLPYPRWDINEDGEVDDVDLGLLLLHYGEDYR